MDQPVEQSTTLTLRDAKVIGLVSVGHFFAHFYFLVLPPIFPILKIEFGVSYTALGLLLSVFSLAAAIGQTPLGFLVDRLGGRSLLKVALLTQGAAVALIGLSSAYWMLLVLFLVAGLANTVFHPADYAILSGSVARGRLGRAFSVHAFAGNLGWVAAPPLVIGLSALWDWRVAMILLGAAGIVIGCVVWWKIGLLSEERPAPDRRAPGSESASLSDGLGLLLSPPILMGFLFYLLMSMAFGSVQTFSVVAFVTLYDVPLAVANGALTGYLLGGAVGILVGGYVADKFGRSALIAVLGLVSAGVLLTVVGSISAPMAVLTGLLTLAGFAKGAVQPARDLLIRYVTPEGSAGKVFGFVSSGLNLGGAVMPLMFGWILDHGNPRWVFWLSALVVVAALVTVTGLRRPPRR